jgi:hypothetical protein
MLVTGSTHTSQSLCLGPASTALIAADQTRQPVNGDKTAVVDRTKIRDLKSLEFHRAASPAMWTVKVVTKT